MHEPYVRNEQGFAARSVSYIKTPACEIPFATICKNADADAESAYHYTQPQINRTRQDEVKARLFADANAKE